MNPVTGRRGDLSPIDSKNDTAEETKLKAGNLKFSHQLVQDMIC
jgi:hypothetical protein